MAKYMRKAEREAQILETALGHRQVGRKTFTVYKMAAWLGMSASTHLRNILMGLVERGVLEITTKKHRANIEKAVFSLKDETLLSMALF